MTGYGLVVGLAGTGSGDVPLLIRTQLEDEMAKRGVGRGEGPLASVSPASLIDDRNTAVVLVEAVIPPAAPEGQRFDVSVSALPGSTVTSLEGGRLYTADLFRGVQIPGGPATAPVATARGELFINPFDAPGVATGETSQTNRTRGRVLNGGVVSSPFRPVVMLDNPSHSRARGLTAAINNKFPQRGNRSPVARGLSEELVEINVPAEYGDDTYEFYKILEHMRIDQSFPEEWARRYTEALKEEPDLAGSLKWCLHAIGPVCIPYLRSLYDYTETTPRMAALEAGARLGDPLTRIHLEDLAISGPPRLRSDAVTLLGGLPTDPRINSFLFDLLDSDDLDIRVAAYEALDQRGDSRISRVAVGEKFRLDVIPAAQPMIYVTQQREPKVVLFGDLEAQRPSFVSAWDGRLMLSSDSPSDDVRVFYYATTGPARARPSRWTGGS